MIVSRSSFYSVLQHLKTQRPLALDSETTGLRPWNEDRLFSIIIADKTDEYYFNFQAYENFPSENILPTSWLKEFQALFDLPILWFIHNAKFDLAFLHREGLTIRGEVHCTQAIARVEYNEHLKYSLDSCLQRIGLAKDDAVEKYIEEHKLYEKRQVPGKKTQETFKFYDKVPPEIIIPYGCQDARGCYALGVSQIDSITDQSIESSARGLPTVLGVMRNERKLTSTVFRMESCGVRIDREYAMRAARFEADRSIQCSASFESETGEAYKASPKLFERVFASERDLWEYTELGNPSFDSDTLKKFTNPLAKTILELRDAKSKSDFYNSFLYYADTDSRVHPSFRQDGAAHGRFSSANPNFQNLTSEPLGFCKSCQAVIESLPAGSSERGYIHACSKCSSSELHLHTYLTRRAVVPTPGYVFVSVDFLAMEFRFMLELACRMVGHSTPLVELIKTGLDVHEATAQLASQAGVKITRAEAKTSNFLTIYGGGNQKLADGLKCSLAQAKAIRQSIFKGAPEIMEFVDSAISTAKVRGFVFSWLGRKCHFPHSEWSYRAPNYLVAGGCADIVKISMNEIYLYLQDKKSRLVLTIHDELVVEVHETEIQDVPLAILSIMENTFPHKYLPLKCSAEWF